LRVVPDTVVIGYVHPHTVTEGFARSLAEACLIKDNHIIGIIAASSPRQEHGRNTVISKYLDGAQYAGDHVGAEWLMWIDTDMTFKPDAIKRLLATAKTTKADMVAGLGFVYKRGEGVLIPNAWTWNPEAQEWEDTDDYKSGIVQEIDGTGSGFALINRRVFQHTDNNEWHRSGTHPKTGKYMGHDLAFCYDNIVDGPFKLVWDTNVHTGHVKHFELDENMFRNYQRSK